MRAPQGQATLVGPGYTEAGERAAPTKSLADSGVCDTFQCGHCMYVQHVEPMGDPADAGGLCKCCMRLICERCVDKGTCTPWEVMIERMEDKARFAREVDKA